MSSLILLIIVAAWLVVLVPVLLRRHDAGVERRSTDRFATAMRVLSRKSPTSAESREVLRPGGRSGPSVTVNGTTSVDAETLRMRLGRTRPVPTEALDRPRRRVTAPAAPTPVVSRVDSSAQRCAARRRVLMGLLVLAVGFAAGGLAVTPVVWIPQVVCDLLLIGYVVHGRRQIQAAQARRARMAEQHDRRRENTRRQRIRETRYARAAGAAAERREVTIEKAEDGSWHPVPVPVPTYVTAPVAHRPAQVEAEEEYVAGSTHSPQYAIEQMVADEMGASVDDEWDGYGERRAVNE